MIGRPIRFLALVALAWTAGRAIVLWPGAVNDTLEPAIRYAMPLVRAPMRGERIAIRLNRPAPLTDRVSIALADVQPPTPVIVELAAVADEPLPPPQFGPSPKMAALVYMDDGVEPLPAPRGKMSKRLVVSTWAIMRDRGDVSLAGGGQLGGSQAGFRASYGLRADRSVAIAMRLSGPLAQSSTGRELALGLEWQPFKKLPVRLLVERRFALNGYEQDRFAVGLFGGVDNIALPAGFRLDGYGQAGIVGLSRRDGYVDGALRVERPIGKAGSMDVAVGAGVWGAAQPGVSRLDIGPQLVLRVPTGKATLRFGIDWRQRVAGNARPGSGPALSVGADF